MSEQRQLNIQGGSLDRPETCIRRILVVDDSLLERRIVAASLRRWGYDVLEANDAQSALDLCRRDCPDLILSDWMMPGMTGPEFCRVFRQLSLEKYGYFILLTSKSDATEVAHGLNSGADDFLTKPVNPDELRARIAAGDRILRMERELTEKNRMISETLNKLQEVHLKIDADLVQARTIQDALVPLKDQYFGPSRVSLLLNPCGHIGGDLVGMFSPQPNQVVFYSIDVSGHGITSAMLTARLGSYLSSEHPEYNIAITQTSDVGFAARSPAEVASSLNARFSADAGIDQYFTMVYGVADLTNGHVQLVQAGHPHPLLIKQSGGAEYIGDGGLPLGLFAAARYEQKDLWMKPGDKLLLHSDGFTESIVDQGHMLGEDGFLDMIANSAVAGGREFLDDLFWRLTERMHPDHGMEDDVSAALFEYHGPETGS